MVHSSFPVHRVFRHAGVEERYHGHAGIGLGVDLNWRRSQRMAYTVIGGAEEVAPGAQALAGRYVGGQASATVGVGAGLAILVGGGHKNISLVPIAVEGNTGAGAAAGLGFLSRTPGHEG